MFAGNPGRPAKIALLGKTLPSNIQHQQTPDIDIDIDIRIPKFSSLA
jgi:hypothetical protein